MASLGECEQFPAVPGVGSDEQRRVDAIVAEAKRGIWKPQYQPVGAAPLLPMCPMLVDRRLSEEIPYVQRLLEMMGDQLSGDPVILQRHSRPVQGFDLMCPILGHIAKVLSAEENNPPPAGIAIHESRTP